MTEEWAGLETGLQLYSFSSRVSPEIMDGWDAAGFGPQRA